MYDGDSFELKFNNEKDITFDFVSSAIQQRFNLLTPFELEAGSEDAENSLDGVKIYSTKTLLAVFDSSNNQRRIININVSNLRSGSVEQPGSITMMNQGSPFILVKLFEVDDNSSLNDVNRSFKWQPTHLTNDNNNNDEKEEDWESEYNRLMNMIRIKFSINLLNSFSLVQAKEGTNIDESEDDEVEIDCSELGCIWDDLMDKYDDDDNNKSDVYITFQVILDRNKDNAMKSTINKQEENDEYDHKMIEEVRVCFAI